LRDASRFDTCIECDTVVKELREGVFSHDETIDVLEIFGNGEGLHTCCDSYVLTLRDAMGIEIYGEKSVLETSVEHTDKFVSIGFIMGCSGDTFECLCRFVCSDTVEHDKTTRFDRRIDNVCEGSGVECCETMKLHVGTDLVTLEDDTSSV
jgi:hypothetical protein